MRTDAVPLIKKSAYQKLFILLINEIYNHKRSNFPLPDCHAVKDKEINFHNRHTLQQLPALTH
jgi:hypothetical protein